MLACVDVDYRSDGCAAAACVVFSQWSAEAPAASYVAWVDEVAPSEPGAFFRRELPCILRVLAEVAEPLELVLVDGYVTLDAARRPGLGARLYEALGGGVAVVGAAKTKYAGATEAVPVLRGRSAKPLWIGAIGIDLAAAVAGVRAMHGPHRIPTLLGEVDRLARKAVRS